MKGRPTGDKHLIIYNGCTLQQPQKTALQQQQLKRKKKKHPRLRCLRFGIQPTLLSNAIYPDLASHSQNERRIWSFYFGSIAVIAGIIMALSTFG